MAEYKDIVISIPCRGYGDVSLNLTAETGLIYDVADAETEGEERYQIEEGKTYDYEFDEIGFYLESDSNEILKPFHTTRKDKPARGRIEPGIYVGRTAFRLMKDGVDTPIGEIALEIRSVKQNYRDDYRTMMHDITSYYTELVMQQGSPVTQNFEVNPKDEPETLYQKFAFIKSVIESEQFADAIHKIQANPIHRWTGTTEDRKITNVKRLSRNNIRQLITSNQRFPIDPSEYGMPMQLTSLPTTLTVTSKKDTLDTAENRFVKFALHTFASFCSSIMSFKNAGELLKKEAAHVSDILAHFLALSMFKDVQLPHSLSLNSPALQRKEGYREVLQAWLMFDLAAKLTWKGGDNVYKAGKRNVAALYEYWLFFKLMEIVENIFNLRHEDKEKLVQHTENELTLSLMQGNTQMVGGRYNAGSRVLNVSLYYNKTFSYNSAINSSGSWTAPMRPDYTLSIWPGDITEQQAEANDIIVHIHFDAKYRVNQFLVQPQESSDTSTDELLTEKREQEKGIYKRADLLKMHAYKDAIRRTSGAYILYPGTEKKEPYKGFHEIIPGLGAFCMKPHSCEADAEELQKFIMSVVYHLLNRTSQREKIAAHSHKIYAENDIALRANLPELVGDNRYLIPSETYVILGYYREENRDWILKGSYNGRIGARIGSIQFSPELIAAKYALLYNRNGGMMFFRLEDENRIICTKKELMATGYKAMSPEKEAFYLMFDLDIDRTDTEFEGFDWHYDDICKYVEAKAGRYNLTTISLSELTRMRIKQR